MNPDLPRADPRRASASSEPRQQRHRGLKFLTLGDVGSRQAVLSAILASILAVFCPTALIGSASAQPSSTDITPPGNPKAGAAAAPSSRSVAGRWESWDPERNSVPGALAPPRCESFQPPLPQTICAMLIETVNQRSPSSIQILQSGDRVTVEMRSLKHPDPSGPQPAATGSITGERVQLFEGSIRADGYLVLNVTSRSGFVFGSDKIATKLLLKLSGDGQYLNGFMSWLYGPTDSLAYQPGHGRVLPYDSGTLQWRRAPEGPRLQLLALTARGPLTVSRFFLGMPTQVEAVYDEPQAEKEKELKLEWSGRRETIKLTRDENDWARFLSQIILPGDPPPPPAAPSQPPSASGKAKDRPGSTP